MKVSGPRRWPSRHRAAFFVVAALLLSIVALLPLALAGVVEDIAQSANPTYEILNDTQGEATTHANVNLAMTDLDEWHRTVTIEVAGHHVCTTNCTWSDRFLLVSIPFSQEDGEGLPPSASIDFPPTTKEISKEVKLPVSGSAIRYPFDHYRLELAVVMERDFPDGQTQTVPAQEAAGHLFLSVNGSVPRAVMGKPVPVNLKSVFVDDPRFQYVSVTRITFSRPIYLQVLTVLLVLLVSAAAVYAVFLRPLNELVINSGALVLGVWGIRAILLGANVAGFTVVDLSLIVVILFLLAAITWRALWYLHQKAEESSHDRPQAPRPVRPPDYGAVINGEQKHH